MNSFYIIKIKLNKCITTVATSRAGTAYPSGEPDFTPPPCLVEFVLLDLQFIMQCFVHRLSSFGHCVVCPSIYGFRLPL